MLTVEKNGWKVLCTYNEFLDLWMSPRFKGQYNADISFEENLVLAIDDFTEAGYDIVFH